jgi:hypothetical protein
MHIQNENNLNNILEIYLNEEEMGGFRQSLLTTTGKAWRVGYGRII